jgi:hypothetical protein
VSQGISIEETKNSRNDVPLHRARERTGIIVDFSKFAGQKIVMTNTAGGMKYDLKYIMQFRVGTRLKTPKSSCEPASRADKAGPKHEE